MHHVMLDRLSWRRAAASISYSELTTSTPKPSSSGGPRRQKRPDAPFPWEVAPFQLQEAEQIRKRTRAAADRGCIPYLPTNLAGRRSAVARMPSFMSSVP
jgi:hypothetical protein